MQVSVLYSLDASIRYTVLSASVQHLVYQASHLPLTSLVLTPSPPLIPITIFIQKLST